MSKNAYTPGPWSVGSGDQGWNIIEGPDGETLLYVDPGCYGVEASVVATDEDLNLMAAAPELLEALEALLSRVEKDKDSRSWWTEEQQQARAAIAKAKGEQA